MPAHLINGHCLDVLSEVPELDLIATNSPYALYQAHLRADRLCPVEGGEGTDAAGFSEQDIPGAQQASRMSS